MPSPLPRALLAELIDYAGLFPPAALPLSETAERFAAYRAAEDSWFLGRLVVPVDRLAELRAACGRLDEADWPLSLLAGNDPAEPQRFQQAMVSSLPLQIKSVECKVQSTDDLRVALSWRDVVEHIYCEVALGDDGVPLLDLVAERGLLAKVRLGGTSPAAFPQPVDVVRFMRRCRERRLGFKLTAGLHHALPGNYAVTYEDDAPLGSMLGFVPVLLTAVAVWQGLDDERQLRDMIACRDASRVAGSTHAVQFDGLLFRSEAIRDTRCQFLHSIGSCSFEEPVSDLRELGFWPP